MTKPKKRDRTGEVARLIASRTTEDINPNIKARRDKFIRGRLMGMTKKAAAVYAGVPVRSASKAGAELAAEPYVIEQFARLREDMEDDQLLTRKELLLNVKTIAFDEEGMASPRVSASSLLTDIMGWKKSKVELTGADGGPIQSVQLDPTKLSDEAIEQILNAATSEVEGETK